MQYQGKDYKYRSEQEKNLLSMYIQAVEIHKINGCWHKTAKELGHWDYHQLKSSCRRRLGYTNPRNVVSLAEVKEAIARHIAGEDPDDIAADYCVTRSGLFQRARIEFGYYMSTKSYHHNKDDDGAGKWADILYNKILSYVERVE